jgi:hypothetical protein
MYYTRQAQSQSKELVLMVNSSRIVLFERF